MTRQEFFEKYGSVKVKFTDYYEKNFLIAEIYIFTYIAILPNGNVLTCFCAGDSGDIHRHTVSVDNDETVDSLQPHEGHVYLAGEKIEGFYDY